MHPRLAELLAQLAERRARLLGQLSRVPLDDLRLKPEPDSWSLMQVAQHLELVDRGMLDLLRDPRMKTRPLARRPRNYIGYAALRVVLATGYRVRVPDRVRGLVSPPEHADEDLERLQRRWENTARELEAAFGSLTEADLRRFVGLHPVGGPLTPVQVLLFLRRHFDHHLRQVRRIQARLASLAGSGQRDGAFTAEEAENARQ